MKVKHSGLVISHINLSKSTIIFAFFRVTVFHKQVIVAAIFAQERIKGESSGGEVGEKRGEYI